MLWPFWPVILGAQAMDGRRNAGCTMVFGVRDLDLIKCISLILPTVFPKCPLLLAPEMCCWSAICSPCGRESPKKLSFAAASTQPGCEAAHRGMAWCYGASLYLYLYFCLYLCLCLYIDFYLHFLPCRLWSLPSMECHERSKLWIWVKYLWIQNGLVWLGPDHEKEQKSGAEKIFCARSQIASD